MAAPVTSRTVSLEINGEQISYDVPTRRLLVHFIRELHDARRSGRGHEDLDR